MPRKTQQNHITNPALLDDVNPNNMRLKQDFLRYLESVQRSPGTIAAYNSDLNIFFTWNYLYNNDKDFVKISKRDYVMLQNWLINENKNSPARVRRIKSSISSLGGFIESVLDDEEEFKGFRSVIKKIESPVNQPVRDKTVLSDEQLTALLEQLTSEGKHAKACMLALAMYSGRRKAELVRFKVDDFKEENLVCGGALYKTSDAIKTKGFGLGKFIYCYTLAKEFKPYFDRWMKQREDEGIESIWLFPMKEDPTQQMRSDTLNSWALSFSKMLDVDFYWHSMRHNFCTRLIRAGLPEGVVQEIVGWSSADMVKVYTDIDAEERIGMWFADGGINTDAAATEIKV